MGRLKKGFAFIGDFCITYEEPRVVRIHSVFLFTFYWLLMISVACGISGYFIWYKRGYQDIVPVESAVTTKVFGVGDTNTSDHTIWDKADYMIPPEENEDFTVITNLLITPRQTQQTCDEDPSVPAGRCKVDSDCQKNKAVRYGNGMMTGKCINSTHEANVKVCQIRAWCPVEIDDPSKRSYLASETFIVYIKNSVRFPAFGEIRQNIPGDMGSEELSTCLFDSKHPRNKHCPFFKVNTIVEETGNSFRSIVVEGAVIQIIISWDCDFDYSNECRPEYSFYRLDQREDTLSSGFHMRFADKYVNKNGSNERTLYKAYGIRLIVGVQGRGRKFGFIVTAMTIGSGLSYFAIATFVISKLVLPFYRNLCWRTLRYEGLCMGNRCGKILCSCLQKIWAMCNRFYKPLEKAARGEEEGKDDDLREINFHFKDTVKRWTRTEGPLTLRIDVEDSDPIDDADSFGQSDHGL
ncbi:P2X purinoceptor 4-like [Littorina saxatilis]|uniref:P2X purinoceptor n=1 Tax=Littorina saxatilis TaxID=31220 RepID=A0AAN9FWD0_9CAEN